MSYDIKYRQRVIDYLREGHTDRDAAAVFKVSTSTIWKWKSKLKENGTLAPETRQGHWRKIDPEKLAKYVDEHPDAYQYEIAAVFGVRLFAIQRALKRLQITRKKNYTVQGKQGEFSTSVSETVE
jgi:transposase